MGKTKFLKFISWNVNGIRACTKNGFLDFLNKEKPDFLAIQETKAQEQQLGKEITAANGYKSLWFSAKKLGYSGVAIFIKEDIEHKATLGLGIEEFDNEGRCISLELKDNIVFVNTYFPNSQEEGKRLDYKIRFCNSIKEYLDKKVKAGKNIILCGDYNIAHTPIDLVNAKANEKNAGYLPEERAWIDSFFKNGYVDTFRMFNKEKGFYTWWSYRTKARERNAGWRIDYHCVNEAFKDNVHNSFHYADVTGSDHCPVGIEILQ